MTTDERFVNACRKAAELRPDLFRYGAGFLCDIFILEKKNDDGSISLRECVAEYGEENEIDTTQDDIDAMANALGRRLFVYPRFDKLSFLITESDGQAPEETHTQLSLGEKLTAAKEAFIAIIEQIEKEK